MQYDAKGAKGADASDDEDGKGEGQLADGGQKSGKPGEAKEQTYYDAGV